MSIFENIIEYKRIIITLTFVLLILLESLIPAYQLSKTKLEHDLFNFVLGGLNMLLTALVLVFAFQWISDLITERKIGLFFLMEKWPLAATIIILILFDCAMYFWHRINHKIDFFWQFHALHHIDEQMDSSSAIRFHIIEISFSCIYRLPIMCLLGMSLEMMLLYEIILLPVIIFHHSAIRLHPVIDQPLSYLIVTPGLHRVHHSPESKFCHSNFASILSVWDKIFGTYNHQKNNQDCVYGLKGMTDNSRLKAVFSMLFLSFLKKNKDQE